MSIPEVETTISGLRFTWDEEALQAKVTRIRESRSGPINAEILVTTNRPGWANHIHQAQLNLTSSPTRAQWAKLLAQKYDGVAWANILEQICVRTLEYVRQGEPVVDLDPSKELKPPEYVVFPLMPERKPTVIFGEGGTGKSWLGLAAAACVLYGWDKNPLGFKVPKARNVMYLDWEEDAEDLEWRWHVFLKGHRLEPKKLPYLRCIASLPDDIEQLQEKLADRETDVVIIDSMAGASGGNLKEDEAATRLFMAIRKLKVTSLIIAHTSKNTNNGDPKSIYGSAFFGNWSRSVWELKHAQEPGEDQMDVCLFHRKANQSKKFQPLGFRVCFDEFATTVISQDAGKMVSFWDKLTIPQRIVTVIERARLPLTDDEVVTQVGAKKDSVITNLHRLHKDGRIAHPDAKHWAKAAFKSDYDDEERMF